MNAFEAYQLFQAIKLHFTSKYDYFKYNGKTNVTPESFETRKDKYHYHKLSKQQNPLLLCVSGNILNSKLWVGQLFDDEFQENYKKMVANRSNLKHTILKDLSKYDDFDDMFLMKKGKRAKLYHDYLRGNITIETMTVVTDVCPVWDYWKTSSEKIIIDIHQKLIENYRPFLSYTKKEFHKLLTTNYE